MRILELIEYYPRRFRRTDLAMDEGTFIWQQYRDQINVEFPSPKTNDEWELTSKGWVGYIPLRADLAISIKPKIELKNLFLMLEYAYRLRSLKFLTGLMPCDSLSAFYQQLAKVLSRRVIDRGKKGFYHAYIEISERLACIKGRLDVNVLARSPWRADLWCHYQNYTPDIIDNQILAWTLGCIARTGICTDETLSEVKKAFLSLQPLVQFVPFSPQDCIGRLYNRLNEDYEPLHALCRFFLEHSAPTLGAGTHTILPFLIDMDRLYELFVAEWLAEHLPAGFYIKPQENVCLGGQGIWSFRIDLVIYDSATGLPWCVADTKYKAPDTPSSGDIAQVVTYAELKGCREAVLVYPTKLPMPINEPLGSVQVRSLTFDLSGDLEKGGQEFVKALLK